MKYPPKAKRKGLKIPFGYYLHPADPCICLPNAKSLDALHYAFRMKAKYNTSLRDCVMWLHQATGEKITHHGFDYAYKAWIKRLKKEKKAEIDYYKKAVLKANQAYADKNLQDFTIELDDGKDIPAVAERQAQAKINAG